MWRVGEAYHGRNYRKTGRTRSGGLWVRKYVDPEGLWQIVKEIIKFIHNVRLSQ
jgi:hypothetical protein